jgi:hypothetical protein
VLELFQERSEICNIVPNAALSCGALASTVAAPVVGENAERARESRHHGRPVLMVAPRAVHQDERLSHVSSDLPIDADSIDLTGRHDDSPLVASGLRGLTSGAQPRRSGSGFGASAPAAD